MKKRAASGALGLGSHVMAAGVSRRLHSCSASINCHCWHVSHTGGRLNSESPIWWGVVRRIRLVLGLNGALTPWHNQLGQTPTQEDCHEAHTAQDQYVNCSGVNGTSAIGDWGDGGDVFGWVVVGLSGYVGERRKLCHCRLFETE